MPPLYRIAEISCYTLLNFLPYLSAALYPFRHRLRYSMPVTVLFVILLTLTQIGLVFWATLIPSANRILINGISIAAYFLFYFRAVKAHFGKTLFTLLMLSNIADFIVVCSKCLEGIFFPSLAVQPYRWSFSAVMFLVQLLVLSPITFYINKVYTNAVEKETNPAAWRYLWLIPATFYLLWFYHLFGNTQSSTEVALQPENTIFLLFINLGAFLIYHMVVCLIHEHGKNQALETQNHLLSLQNLQYENLKYRMDETRRARHDLRHHITMIAGYLNAGELEKLSAYLDGYRDSLPDDSSILYCQNTTVNLLLLYFAQQAKEKDIAFDVYLDLPEALAIAENDLSVLLGNLLENAVTACSLKAREPRQITICGKTDGNTLILTVDNTYENEIRRDKNGSYLSTRHKGAGMGIESVRQIARRYHGTFQTEQKDGVFYASVLLNQNLPE